MSAKPKNNTAALSRRSFLKGMGVGGAGLALAGTGAAALPGKAHAARAHKELATLLDLSQCVGCGACVEACREVNGHKFPEPKKPFPKPIPSRVPIEDWSDRRDVDDRLTPYNWLFIQSVEVEHEGETVELHMPRRCLHCVNPPCADLCPFGSARKEANGIVRIEADLCMGGAKCKWVCPWHIPQRQSGVGLYLNLMPRLAGNGVMYKCDRCHDRLEKGELPACIEACPMDVQQIGPRDEIIAKARELAASMNGYIYGLEENGGTNTIYVSPVPFEAIDAAAKPGKGRPHTKPVADTMASEEKLASAVFLAPIAGLAAGVIRTVSELKKGDD